MQQRAFDVAIQLPPFVLALAVTELFFKLGSFTAEALVFLAVWHVLRLAYGRIVPRSTPSIEAVR